MNEVLTNYLMSFLHPWHTQELLRRKREYHHEVEGLGQLELVEDREKKELKEDFGVTFEQSLIVSWMFVIFNAFFEWLNIFGLSRIAIVQRTTMSLQLIAFYNWIATF